MNLSDFFLLEPRLDWSEQAMPPRSAAKDVISASEVEGAEAMAPTTMDHMHVSRNVVPKESAARPLPRPSDITFYVGRNRAPFTLSAHTLKHSTYFAGLLEKQRIPDPVVLDCDEVTFQNMVLILRYGSFEALPKMSESEMFRLKMELECYGIDVPVATTTKGRGWSAEFPELPEELKDPSKLFLVARMDDIEKGIRCECTGKDLHTYWALSFHHRHTFCTACGRCPSSFSPRHLAEMYMAAAMYYSNENFANKQRWSVGCDSTCSLKLLNAKPGCVCPCNESDGPKAWAVSTYYSHAFCTRCGPLFTSAMAITLRAPSALAPPSSSSSFSTGNAAASTSSNFPARLNSRIPQGLRVEASAPLNFSISSRDSYHGAFSNIGGKGKEIEEYQSPVSAAATSAGEAFLPVQLSEQETFAKEWGNKPRRVVLFVEPSPFSYISGYKNRYQNFIRYLRELGDEVLVVTTHVGVPEEFYGAKVIGSWSFPLPWYQAVPLSLALSPRIYREVKNFKPDIIHASSPGVMVFGALIISKLVGVPVVMAYHTHVPMYIPKYTFSWLVKPMWLIIKLLHRAADLTLVMSVALGKELRAAGASTAERIRIWRKGVDSDSFHPRFKSAEMRNKITDGKPNTPTIVHVGRLGVEKNLDFLVDVMERIPEARLVFVGDGPHRPALEMLFTGKNVHFTGMLSGEELSQAYASGDIFITPSETETLGFVVLEAMASGVPVVCARAGGIPDIVNQEGVTGFLYTPGDVDDCVAKLSALINDEELRTRIGQAGREEVEKFDWRASTKQVRNQEYSAAIWFWRRRRQELADRFSWLFSRPEPLTS